MADREITKGATNQSVEFTILQDASATSPGEPKTGLLFSDIETGGSASYVRSGAARVDLTLITLASASATHADGGFILVDDTNSPGQYRCDFPDLAFATGADFVTLHLVVESTNNAMALPIKVQLAAIDKQVGLTVDSTLVDLIYDENKSGHTTASTYGKLIQDIETTTAKFIFTVANLIDSNVLAVSDDTVAADNLELMYDGTGYTGVGAPSSREQVDGLGASSGGSVNIQVTEDNVGGAIIDSVTFVGSVQGSTTFSNTEAEDGVYHDIDDTGNDIDIVYGFSVGGGRTASDVIFAGFVQGNGDEMKIKAFDHVGSDWEIVSTVTGANGTTNVVLDVPLLLKHTGTGAELGKVYIRFDTDSTTPSNLSVDKLLVSAVNIGQSVGYAGGQIWIDTVNGVAGTEAFVNGVADNAVNLIASAKTLSTSVGLSDFHIINGSTITLAESTANESYFGDNWTLALGGQACGGAHFDGATVTGIATGTGTGFHGGALGTSTIGDDAHLDEVGLSGTITLPAGEVNFFHCHHDGSSAPVLDFGAAVGSTTVHLHHYSGGIEFQNIGDSGTDIVHLDGNGKLIINSNSSGGTVNLRGNWEIDNQASGVTINRRTGQSAGYANGSIWINTNASNTNTEDFADGIVENPVSTIAAAKTLSTSLGISDFHVINGSSVTLAESTTNESYFGDNWTLALGGQDVAGAYVQGATVSGVGTSSSEVHFEGCDVATASVQKAHFDFCSFNGTVTQTLAGDYKYHNCYPGDATPVFTKTAGQAVTATWSGWSGAITLSGIQSGDTMSLEGTFGAIILNGASGTVDVHGIYESITDNRSSSPTLTIAAAVKGADVASILVDTAVIGALGAGLTDLGGMSTGMKAEVNAEMDTAFNTAIPGSPTAASVNAVLKNQDFAARVILTATVDTATNSHTPTTTEFQADDITEATTNHFKGRVVVFTSGVLLNQATDITGYVAVGGIGQFTVTTMTEAPANNDTFVIV